MNPVLHGNPFFLCCLAVLGFFGSVQVRSAAPTNEFCNSVHTINTLPASLDFDNTLAAPGNEINCPETAFTVQHDVWYRYTVPADCLLRARVSVAFAGDLIVYVGAECSALSGLSCNRLGAGKDNVVTVNAQAGETYWFQIGSQDVNEFGLGHLDLECATPAVNDTCHTATGLVFPGGGIESVNFDLGLAHPDGGPPGSCNEFGGTAMQNDIWFSYTSDVSSAVMSVRFDTLPFNGICTIYEGSCSSLVERLCISPIDSDMTYVIPVASNQTYFVQVGVYGVFSPDFGSNYQGRVTFLAGKDFGDAPVAYEAGNPATHGAVVDLQLGTRLDSEPVPASSPGADGDNQVGLADEDGVVIGGSLISGQVSCITVIRGKEDAKLDAWIDYDQDQVFEVSEHINGGISISLPFEGSNLVCFPVPISIDNCPSGVQDGSFEGSGGFSLWNVVATNYPTPIVQDQQLSLSGLYTTWFGSINTGPDIASISQQVTLPAGDSYLRFGIYIKHTSPPYEDVMRVKLDDVVVAEIPEPEVAQTGFSIYVVPLNIEGTHTLTFEYRNLDTGESTYYMDDIVLVCGNPRLGPTFARFRLSSSGGLGPTGSAPDGEVEDYPVTIEGFSSTGGVSRITGMSLEDDFLHLSLTNETSAFTIRLQENQDPAAGAAWENVGLAVLGGVDRIIQKVDQATSRLLRVLRE